MNAATFPLNCTNNLNNCLEFIQQQDLTGGKEVVVRNATVGKTISQLGGLFGAWAKYASEQTGYTIDELHLQWKHQWLCRIYAKDPLGKEQQAWVEMLIHLQEKGDRDGIRMHSKGCSLKWARVAQMREYMSRIEEYYISAGMPLPVLDKFREVYR